MPDRKSWFYAIYGLAVPGITFLVSFLIAFSFGAAVRGEFAYAFATMNILIAILSGPESGIIRVNTSQNLLHTTDQRIVFLTYRNIFLSFLVLTPYFLFYQKDFLNLIYMSISCGISSGLIIKGNQLLSLGKKIQSVISISSLWIIFLILILLLNLREDLVDIDDVLINFSIACIISGFIVLRPVGKPIITAKNFLKFRIDKSSIFAISNLANIAQLNGMIIVLKPFLTFKQLGILALGISFLNGALSVSFGIMNGQIWEKNTFKKTPSFALWFIPTSIFFLLGFVAQAILGSEFNGIAQTILLLLPFYFAVYVTEFFVIKNYVNANYPIYIKMKFILILITLSLIFFFERVYSNSSLIPITLFGGIYLLLSLISIALIQAKSLRI